MGQTEHPSVLPISIALDGDQINRAVVDAILASTLGEHVKKAIEAVLKTPFSARGSVVEEAVKNEVYEQVRRLCRKLVSEDPTITEAIGDAVRERLNAEKIAELADGFVKDLGLLRTEDMRS